MKGILIQSFQPSSRNPSLMRAGFHVSYGRSNKRRVSKVMSQSLVNEGRFPRIGVDLNKEIKQVLLVAIPR